MGNKRAPRLALDDSRCRGVGCAVKCRCLRYLSRPPCLLWMMDFRGAEGSECKFFIEYNEDPDSHDRADSGQQQGS